MCVCIYIYIYIHLHPLFRPEDPDRRGKPRCSARYFLFITTINITIIIIVIIIIISSSNSIITNIVQHATAKPQTKIQEKRSLSQRGS